MLTGRPYAYKLLAGNLGVSDVKINPWLEQAVFSFFDTGSGQSEVSEPERFYHGFVLGLMVELADRYTITSNRESGFGRYDVILEPVNTENDTFTNNCGRDAIIMEFKVHNPGKKGENTLEDTVQAALQQIEEKQYAAGLLAKGIPEDKIRKYGFAFAGKKVLIGGGGKALL